MRKMLRLAKQRLQADWKIYLAALLLTSLTCSAYLIYQGYMEQVGLNYGRKTSELDLIADYQVELTANELLPSAVEPTGAWKSRPTPELKAMGRALPLNSTYGQVNVLALRPHANYSGPLPQAGQVLVNERLAQGLGLPTTGSLTLANSDLGTQITLQIGGSFDSSSASGHVLVLYQDLQPLLPTSGYNIFLYDSVEQLKLQPALDALNRFYPNSLILTSQQAQIVAQQAVRDTYQGFGSLVLLIFVFLTLGILTALLLSFIDSKRELSVMKSIGLMPRELWGLFLITGLATAVAGYLLGIGLAYLASHVMQARGVFLAPLSRHILSLSWRVLLAYTLAIAVPAGLARRATVNQLLLDQPIPLFSNKVTILRRHRQLFEEELAQGWQVVQLPVIEGVLEGFVFKKEGDQVKVGEVLAFSPGWWGLTYTEYVAIIDGEVAIWREESGILAIKPHTNNEAAQ